MTSPEDALAQAERQVREGEVRVTRQAGLLRQLQADGDWRAAAMAKRFLALQEKRLADAEEHLRKVRVATDAARQAAPSDQTN